MKPDAFLRDVLAAPERLAACSTRTPAARLAASRASAVAARCLHRHGELALRCAPRGGAAALARVSTPSPSSPRPGSRPRRRPGRSRSGSRQAGSTRRDRRGARPPPRHESHASRSRTTPTASLRRSADVVLPLHAGTEEGGVACLTFQATLAVLQPPRREPAVDDLRARGRGGRRPACGPRRLAARARRPPRGGTHDVRDRACRAPRPRRCSPRSCCARGRGSPADATETGDWLHVDVYLSKRPGYTALLFPGSRFDDGVMAYARERGVVDRRRRPRGRRCRADDRRPGARGPAHRAAGGDRRCRARRRPSSGAAGCRRRRRRHSAQPCRAARASGACLKAGVRPGSRGR